LPVVPIAAAFLAGSLLTLLLPVALLIALGVWYWMFSARVSDTPDGRDAAEPASHPSETGPPAHEV
jgi:hypothetical protein